MTIAYYVSGHGLGHAARACTVMQALPPEVPLVVRSAAPASFFAAELGRSYELVAGGVDAVLVHEDSITIDRRRSLEACAAFLADEGRVAREATWLRARGVELVVSDAAWLPLQAASAAGLPSALVCNFTWADIYRPFAAAFAEFAALIPALERAYAQASVAYVTEWSLPMPYLERVERVPLIARRGVRRRQALAERYGLQPGELWVLYYPGPFGLNVDFAAVETIPGVRLLSFSAIEGGPRRLQVVERGQFAHPDLVASVDVVLSKPGYMLAGECAAAGTPLILVPRADFAEDAVVLAALEAWGGLVALAPADFTAGRWQPALERARRLRPRPLAGTAGAQEVAARLQRTWHKPGRR